MWLSVLVVVCGEKGVHHLGKCVELIRFYSHEGVHWVSPPHFDVLYLICYRFGLGIVFIIIVAVIWAG